MTNTYGATFGQTGSGGIAADNLGSYSSNCFVFTGKTASEMREILRDWNSRYPNEIEVL